MLAALRQENVQKDVRLGINCDLELEGACPSTVLNAQIDASD